MNTKVILVVAAIAIIILSTLVLQNSKTIEALNQEIVLEKERSELLSQTATLEAARSTKTEAEILILKERLENCLNENR